MAKLAIKGHPTRGKEIIQLLEMLGGMNKFEDISFITPYIFLFVDDDYYTEIGWDFIGDDNNYEEFVIYTLEEFEEKYPYKVGDVVACYAGLLFEKEIHTITGMQWDSDRCGILYYLDSCDVIEVEDILYSVECKTEQSKQERVKDMDLKNYGTATIKYIQENGSRDMELIIPYNQEIVNIDGRYILRDKKLQCPKTYAECCDIMHIEMNRIIYYEDGLEYRDITRYDINLLTQLRYFRRLLICRDAYWKIAGEQMGLGKPWEPDFTNNDEERYGIYILANKVERDFCGVGDVNMVLSFPTEEMRDAFYENFKELINECKELL